MLKRFGRKALSLLLVFVLMATTFFIFDPSILIPESKAVVDVKKLVNTVEPTVKLYVPEAIYLNPVIGSGSQPYSFQYFIDSDENGTLRRSATQTTGTVYFSCSAACSSISLSWENSTVNATTNTSTNQILKQTITGGTTSVRDGRVKVTATYVVDGRTYNAYAYTYMYYPDLDLLTGVAGSYVYSTSIGNEPKLSAFSFITGVHKVGNTTTYNETERGVSNYYDQYNTTSSKGAFGLSPLIPNWSTTAEFKKANDDAYIDDRDIIYGEKTTSLNSAFIEQGNGGVYFHNRDRGGTSKYFGSTSLAWGTLFVDTSRVTNFNQIPNLRGGFIVHRYDSSGTKGKLVSFKSTDDSISIMSEIDYRNGDGKGYGMTSAEALSGTPANKDYTMESYFNYERKNSSGVHVRFDFGLKVRTVNKASLREAYRNAIENGWQSSTASKNGWSSSVQSSWTTAYNNYVTALDQAGTVLGRPYASATDVSNALSNLNSKVSACNTIINANFTGGENSDVLPQVYFYVPETIYLNPSDNQTFQYFYGVDTNGNPTKNMALSTATGGARIYFAGKNCTPTSVKITVASSTNNETTWSSVYDSYINSITYGGTSMTGSVANSTGKSYNSFPVNIQCTAGKMNAAIASSSYRFMRWTAEYVVGGITYKTYAYTTVYSPYDKPAAAAVRVYNSRGVECDLQQIAWISGLTDCNTNGNRTNNTTNFDPIRGVVLQPTNTENNGGYSQNSGTYINGSSGTGYFENRDANDVDQGAQAVAPTGQLVIDSTRFSNLQYIPNLKIGFMISYVNQGSSNVSKRRFGYYFSDVTGTSFTSPSGYGESENYVYYNNRGTAITSYTTYESYDGTVNRNICYPRQVYNGTWNKEVTSSTTVSVKGAGRFGIRKKSNDKTSNSNGSCVVPMYVTVVNKGSLRSRYYDAVTLSKQQDWYAAGYDNYQNSILTMALNLEHPARTTIDSTVNTKDLVTRTGSTTAVHLRGGSSEDYNGKTGAAIIGTTTESKGYTYGDRVYGYYNEIPGFTKSNYSVTYGVTTNTSGILQDSAYNNYYYIPNANTETIAWKFWYTPNTYNIKYDPNGGTYNGTTGLTSSSVLFQSKYTVAKIGSSTPANPTRAGCTFMGWKCSADNLVYQPGANINWEFLEDVTFTAQWEYNMVNLYYNENHDKLASNMLDPLVDGTISYDSTATISSTNDAGETVTTNKACNLKIEKLDDGTIRINGTLAGNYTFGFVPFDFEDGKEYVFSNNHISGSLTNGCMVIDPSLSDGNNVSPRNQFDFSGSGSKTITPDLTYAGYRFWIWHNTNGGSYMTFDNYTFKPRIELKSDSTSVPTSSTEYNNIFSNYIQYNTLISELPTPTRTGYTFDGWYTKAEGGTKVNVGDRLLCSDWDLNNTNQTLYAHWTINKYKLMYENEFKFDSWAQGILDANTGTTGGTASFDFKENTYTITSDGTTSQPRFNGNQGGWTFLGHRTDSTTQLIPGHTYRLTYDVIGTAATSTHVSMFMFPSTSSTDYEKELHASAAIQANTKKTVTMEFTVSSGYTYPTFRFGIYGGSSNVPEGVSLTYSNISLQDITDPLNYRAGDSQNPSLNKNFDTVTFNATQNPLATITRQGYTFNGWYQSQNTSNGNGYGTQFTTSTAMPAKDVPLYAQWKLNDYSIVINLNADSTDKATIGSFTYSKANNNTSNGNISLSTATSSQQTSAGNIATINVAYGTSFTLPIPSRPGFTFTGWTASATPAYASLTNNGNTSASSYRVGAGGVTLTANWSRNSYPVKAYAYGDIYNSATFALGRGGTVQIASDAAGTSVSKNIAYRSTTTLKATAATGYAFVGWYTDANFTNLYSTSASITSESVLTAGRTYYAKFKVQSYTITVNPDNATTGTTISGWYSAAGTAASSQTIKTSTNITMVYGSTLTMTAPQKTGYTFTGWARTAGSTGTLNSSTGNSTYVCGAGAATLTAQWKINQYTITVHALANKFDTNTYSENGLGGTVQIDSNTANNKNTSATYNYNTSYTIKAVAYTGYKFEGWYTNSSLSGTPVSTSTSYTTTLGASNITYYAKFSVQSYQITVNPNGATGGTNLSGWYSAPGTAASAINGVTTSRTITMVYGSTLTMTASTRNGYTFSGWSRTSGTTGTLNSSTGNSTYVCGAGAATLTAQWNVNTYTIKFESNGGSVNPTSKTFTIESTIDLPTPSKTGYTFSGWKVTTASGNWVKDTVYTGSSIAAGKYGDVTVTAQWTPIKYTITYVYNNGAANTTANYTIEQSITLPSPSKTGYTFAGWKVTTAGGNWNTSDSAYKGTVAAGKYGNVTLTAQWTANAYTITYEANGGAVTPKSDTFTIEKEINLPTPTRTGYVFDGWLVTKAEGNWTNGTLYTGSSITAGKYGNVTVTAQWHKDVLVHFYSGSKGAVHNQFSVTFKNSETTGTVTAPTSFGTVSGWTALGWTASTAASKTVGDAAIKGGATITVTPAKDEYVYYAIYTQSQTLKYEANANGDTSVKNIPANGTLAGAYYNSADTTLNVTRTIPSTVPTRNGYTFKSWNTQANGSGTNYAAGASYTNSAQTDTLYAQWTENQYTITYVNGNGSDDAKVGYKITTEITIIAAPTYDGYVFVGWKVTTVTNGNWTSGDLYGAGTKVGSGKYGDVTLVAQWVYVKDAENKSDEYNQDNTISIITGVDANGNATSITTTKYDTASYKKYQDAINAYNNAKKAIPTDVNASDYSTRLATATKTLQDAINSLVDITLNERGVVTDYLNNFLIDTSGTRHSLSEMNLNHYDLATTVETAKNALVNGNAIKAKNYSITAKDTDGKTFQTKLNEYVAAMAKAFKTKTQVKTEGPGFKVYENADAAKAVTDANGKTLAGATAVNYVYAGKGNYTYYCYTNSTNPTVLITVDDIANAGRVCYPTTAKATAAPALSGSAKNASAAYTITKIPASNADNDYLTYTKLSIGGASSYYQQKQVITLTPEFTSGTNGTVTYEFTATDDALTPNVATQSALSSGIGNANSWQKNLTDDTTNTKKITIVVDYHSGDQMTVTGDQVNRDTYLNQYHLFRTSGGASNWELPAMGDKVYKVNDTTYGQTDRGSFTFTYELGATDIGSGKINTTDVNEIIKLFKDESNYSAAKKLTFVGTKYWTKNSNGTRVQHEGSGLGYQAWGTNWSYNYYPKSESYTYVHVVDRWGNTVDKVIYVGLQDPKDIKTTGSDGAYTILEDGGSGIDTLSLNAGTAEILADENSTLENNVYRTTGNTVRIKTGEANKGYTLTMKDKATNASTATVESDENGIITFSIEDAMYEGGVYTFMLNGTEINLYDGVTKDKYILNVYDGEAEEGESAEMIVITTGEVGKIRFTDTDGNTVTAAESETNENGTKTWRMSKSRPAGEYEYRISVKVGYNWIEENSTGKLIFTEKVLDTGRIVKAEYDEESGLYKLTIEGRATKVQFITEDGMTRTYTRYGESVKSRKSYDAEGNEVPDTGRLLDHEVWLVNARLYSGQNYTVAGKFEAGWNREGTSSLTAN